jgi:hypothetical protein
MAEGPIYHSSLSKRVLSFMYTGQHDAARFASFSSCVFFLRNRNCIFYHSGSCLAQFCIPFQGTHSGPLV